MFNQYREISDIFRIKLPPLNIYTRPSWTYFADDDACDRLRKSICLALFGDTTAMMNDIKKYGTARLPASFVRYKLKQYKICNAEVRNIILLISTRLSAEQLAGYYPMWEESLFDLYMQGHGWLERANRHCWAWKKR